MQIGGKIYIKAKENPVYSEILIRDTGKGIDTKDIPHLFDRFYRGTNTSENSVGIGLALAKMIITKHNGTIKVENHIEGGALFTIKIYKQNI